MLKWTRRRQEKNLNDKGNSQEPQTNNQKLAAQYSLFPIDTVSGGMKTKLSEYSQGTVFKAGEQRSFHGSNLHEGEIGEVADIKFLSQNFKKYSDTNTLSRLGYNTDCLFEAGELQKNQFSTSKK